ncbi:helix-turn-helix domain-containing protein [Sediminibacterium soli]|uniref:helix-turn-helix domain-containing protein n=1 Tax=Sediminibacterium soli TaxID=2698829 RepID=UPI001379684E|nr:helix-turn-helix domain-containing protein [Sediminibacterium soli]NCI46326.1 helix-turn-helix domain-containing protein [Sediminibacterium soli]
MQVQAPGNHPVSAVIRNGRMAKCITQQELSEKTGISLRSVQRIENEEVIPRAYTVKVLAEYLGVLNEVADVYTGKQEATRELHPVGAEETDVHRAVALSHDPGSNRIRRVIASIGTGLLLLLGGMAFIFQSARFPETAFEAILFWMVIIAVYFASLLRIWR